MAIIAQHSAPRSRAGGRAQFVEFGTQNFATFAGGIPDINTLNMLAVSNVGRGFGSTSFHLLIPGMLLLGFDDVLKFSKSLTNPDPFMPV